MNSGNSPFLSRAQLSLWEKGEVALGSPGAQLAQEHFESVTDRRDEARERTWKGIKFRAEMDLMKSWGHLGQTTQGS